jgi:nucleoside 2-deoxyribosyltransferase
MPAKKLRCFVAIAFGWTDTDQLYAKLESKFDNRLTLRRVDRINHNKDVDDKIIEELRVADLVLADLTYARPSVYFEAGYAQGRPIPVIFTARRDHIGKSATDDARRIHFDLQMRNVIGWTSPTDIKFFQKLARRIALVTAPLTKDRAQAEARTVRR